MKQSEDETLTETVETKRRNLQDLKKCLNKVRLNYKNL